MFESEEEDYYDDYNLSERSGSEYGSGSNRSGSEYGSGSEDGHGSENGSGSEKGTDSEYEDEDEQDLVVHCSKNVLRTMYNNPDFCDMDFIVNSKKFPVNRAIVSAASPELKAMLMGSFLESNSKQVQLSGNELCFELFLKYIYGIEFTIVHLNVDEILEMFRLSDFYNIASLKTCLTNYLSSDFFVKPYASLTFQSLDTDAKKTKMKNFFKLATAADCYNLTSLERRLKNLLPKVSNQFLDSPEFLDTPHNLFLFMLQSDLIDQSEITKFHAILKWFDKSTKIEDVSTLEPNYNQKNMCDSKPNNFKTNDSVAKKTENLTENPTDFFKKCKRKKMTFETCPYKLRTLLEQVQFSKINLPDYFKLISKNPLFHKYMNIMDLGSFFTVDGGPEKTLISFSKSFILTYPLNMKSNLVELTECNIREHDLTLAASKKITIKLRQFKKGLFISILYDKVDTPFQYEMNLLPFNPLEKTVWISGGVVPLGGSKSWHSPLGQKKEKFPPEKGHEEISIEDIFLKAGNVYLRNGKLKVEINVEVLS